MNIKKFGGIFTQVIALSALIISCGPSQKEVEAREAFVKDSIEKATIIQNELEAQRRSEDSINAVILKIHNDRVEVGTAIKKTNLESILKKINAEIAEERQELNRINEWKLGRSPDEKARQVSNQKTRISKLEDISTNLEKEISKSSLSLTFDFQNSPEELVNHIFESAKKSDFSNMRHLIDPYGESKDGVMAMCYIEIASEPKRLDWINNFRAGRIIGEPVIDGDKAALEIAVGPNSDRIQKIQLIRRLDKWYFYDI